MRPNWRKARSALKKAEAVAENEHFQSGAYTGFFLGWGHKPIFLPTKINRGDQAQLRNFPEAWGAYLQKSTGGTKLN